MNKIMQPLDLQSASNHAVSLSEILTSRELRFARQQTWLTRYASTLLSITVVAPGPIKDSPLIRKVFNAALNALQRCFDEQGWSPIASYTFDLPTGPEAFIALNLPAIQLKQQMIILEQQSLGRLWDIDVIAANGVPLSRIEQQLAPRRCLLCKQEAKLCARARTHTIDELVNAMQQLVEQYELLDR